MCCYYGKRHFKNKENHCRRRKFEHFFIGQRVCVCGLVCSRILNQQFILMSGAAIRRSPAHTKRTHSMHMHFPHFGSALLQPSARAFRCRFCFRAHSTEETHLIADVGDAFALSRRINNRKPIELCVRAHKLHAARAQTTSSPAHFHHCKRARTLARKIHLFYDHVIWFGYCWLLVTQRNCSLRQLFLCARATGKRTTDIWGSSRISAHFPFRFAPLKCTVFRG